MNIWPDDVKTLAIDIGGTGFKAAVLDPEGVLVSEQVRIDTPYPCTPEMFVATLKELVLVLPHAHRVTVGFPSLIRDGIVSGIPGSLSRRVLNGERDPGLIKAWLGFDIRAALTDAFELPTVVENDADIQGCAVIKGQGMEFVITLGTGIGTALFFDGGLVPHLELSHGPYDATMTHDIALGDGELKRIGEAAWKQRVIKGLDHFKAIVNWDHLYVGGGNARLLGPDELEPGVTLVSNANGLLGGVRIWDLSE
ncbi:MAG: ROK family protein [Actinomycetes bacterium]